MKCLVYIRVFNHNTLSSRNDYIVGKKGIISALPAYSSNDLHTLSWCKGLNPYTSIFKHRGYHF